MTVSEADAFVRARPRLLRIARRVLLNPADADDVVQEAWVRWQETDRTRVRDPAAFLTTTTTRLALNVGRSARARREACAGAWPADWADPATDLVGAVERGDAVEQALRTLLERLSPTECAAFVLREAFDYPHRRVGQVLGLREDHARQVAVRARRRLGSDGRRTVDGAALVRLRDAFLAAARTGALADLERLLAGRALRPAA
ncbi:MAG TPA: sigma-70 family RNA polymerase sigma factor [Solirubrobacter sp.]|nr:sigma-70 family RNA polymerase sigma factor [Solirubrobacter sp.]